MRKNETEYNVKVNLYGLPAYIIDKLLETGLYGFNREDALERIVCDWIEGRLDKLENLGIDFEEAKRKGYIPIKIKEDKV
jgi:hypothetical protein